MSGSAALTGQETIGVTSAGGVAETVTLNQIAALVALQVAINLGTIVDQATSQISTNSGSGLDLSSATVTPGNATTKATLASLIAGLLPLAGGTMSGALKLAQLPVEAADATNKAYVDNAVASGSGSSSSDEAIVAAAQAAASAATSAAATAATAATTAIANARGTPGGLVALDSTGAVVIEGTSVFAFQNGLLIFKTTFQTTDPGVSGALWNNGNYLGISTGAST